MAFSMAWQAESRQAADGDAAGSAREVPAGSAPVCRGGRMPCSRLGDAVLAAGRVPSLPYLSQELAFRRGHGMVYQGLARGPGR